ncbi:MAG TPA: hypothetical protein VE988_17605 [Gemmataceae bacterium]|nr:hypothetical protein [Gemmataceae bacterium]
MTEPRPLHRLFGLSWMDFFQGTDIEVETEIDLSLKQQFIDVVLIRRGPGPIPRPLPDGFEELAAHNLVTFKSHQEALDAWALWELVGHFVNYRKQTSPSMQELLPEGDFRLFAVCARFPDKLAKTVKLPKLREGVFEIRLAALPIRIVVVSQLPQTDQNVMLHLFSAREELLRYARAHYQPYSKDTSSLLLELFAEYNEDPDMPDKLKAFVQETMNKFLGKLPPEELRKRLSVRDRLKGLSVDEVFNNLSPQARKALARKLKANGSSAKPH